jgi:transglutaminase-like putative cysteine protease
MYRLMTKYIPDVKNLGWRSITDVFNAVKDVPYRADAGATECLGAGECVKRPGYTLALGGDCDDKTILAGAGLMNLGVPVRIVTTSYREDEQMQHVYLEVLIEGRWYPFDATYPDNVPFLEAPYTAKQVWGRIQ